MATRQEVQDAILDKINEALASTTHRGDSAMILDLAEAFAWVFNPSQSHGGGTQVKKD